MKILFLGDVFAKPGMLAVKAMLPRLVKETGAGFVIANGENTASGYGLTVDTVRDLFDCGVDVVTTGNHVWDKREMLTYIERMQRVVRPANFTPEAPGRGWCVVEKGARKVGVLNLVGRVFMDPVQCPFRAADVELEAMAGMLGTGDGIIVDFHAEATSEKQAMGHHLDGRVTAVVGTHTHVATADAQVLPGGTGYITDVGMTGVTDSVIGLDRGKVTNRFITRLPEKAGPAKGKASVNAVLLHLADNGLCSNIRRIEMVHG